MCVNKLHLCLILCFISLNLVSKGVIERKHWAKFGASKRDPPGPNSATTVVGDPVSMFFIGSKEPDSKDDLTDLRGDGKGFVRCRYCQENHFSAKCPYKDAGISTEFLLSSKDLAMEDKKVRETAMLAYLLSFDF